MAREFAMLSVSVSIVISSLLCGCGEPSLEGVGTEMIHDVLWPNDTVIPSEGGEFCFYNKLPEDQVYHATKFTWTESALPNWEMAMMFTISDEAVQKFQEQGWDLSKPFPCSALFLAMYSGGYMLFQQGGEEYELNKDWGFLVGKGTARRHALIRWKYIESPDGQPKMDHRAGFHIHLTTNLRKVNVGEAKFATKGPGGSNSNNSISIPAGEAAWVHRVQSTSQASKQVWRGSGVELLQVKPIGRLGYHVRILEAKGGGHFSSPDSKDYDFCSLPHHGNLLLEEGNFQEIYSLQFPEVGHWYDVGKRGVTIKGGNSYRVEYTYDTRGQNETTINGFGPAATGFDLHFLYREIPGDNEPYPGYVMDIGPWFLRSPNVENDEAMRRLAEWRQDPSHGPESSEFGCPNKGAR